MNRRHFLGRAVLGSLAGPALLSAQELRASRFRLATFSADVTPPIGSPLFAVRPAKQIVDPLFARGFVLLGGERPVVLCAVDWLEIRNDAHDRWREALADAAETTRERVLLTSVHQHDAPIADLEAQRIIERAGVDSQVIGLEFHERCVQRAATALKDSLPRSRPVTHLGLGQAKVEKIASNRRIVRPDGTIDHGRGSASGGNPLYRDADEGALDPWLKTISFWRDGQPLAALSSYATHPMSYYGQGEVSADFPGLARARRQADDAGVFQIYASGCSGNVTAGKYNDGSRENRPILAGRLYQGMLAAWEATRRQPLARLAFRSVPLRLEPRQSPGFTEADLKKTLLEKTATPFSAFAKCRAALGLSWLKRAAAGQPIDVAALDFGPAQIILLPAEAYVEYQLYAQSVRPESFVMALGYGESAPGYIPIDRAWEENDSNLRDWCWVAPGAEKVMKEAVRTALRG